MKLSLFDYRLPPELIAQRPAEPRDSSQMMVLDREGGGIEHRGFRELPALLRPGDLLVVNETRVIPARLIGRRSSGARVEILLLHRLDGGCWRCLVSPGRRVRPGDEIDFGQGVSGEVVERTGGGTRSVRFRHEGRGEFLEALERVGRTPLPPYIKRPEPDPADRERYQTVFASSPGAVAAPTAGLHFTPGVLGKLRERGVETARLTLHVGLGTFRPVEVENIEEHRMDAEWFEIGAGAAEKINAVRSAGGRLVAVGTTVVRSLESAWNVEAGAVRPTSGWTELFISPGYRFRSIDALLTNFHLPRSSLLMLVCALAGREAILAAYAEAIERRYRFYSYGDCMLIV